ncbi:unnamed protein product [Brassica napus]|uniref:(rape) hypothetical protein n=1 Tax=Brassica napus TaxID=3708 RepID=A0A816IM40_BRANA|nr:unnamed protein product [Brassica napus]
MIFFLFAILAISLSKNIVSASGVEMKITCSTVECGDGGYGPGNCLVDCKERGYVPCRTMLATTATIVTYVVFNREMTKLTKQDAAALALEGSISSFKASVIGGEGRETTASASNTVPAAKIEIGGDEANLAGFQGKDNSRKRP